MIKLIIGLLMTFTATITTANSNAENKQEVLADYIIWSEKANAKSIIRQKVKALQFPLSVADKQDIETLEKKFDSEEFCAGLAAPQIGIAKQFIIFQVPDDPKLKKWRLDLTQSMPKTIWLNPSYEPLSEETHEDFEACFSIPNTAGPVKRYTKIKYRAYDKAGNLIEGIAEGFLARVIQHEIDHLKGILYIDHVPEEKMLSMEEYIERRKKAMEVMEQE